MKKFSRFFENAITRNEQKKLVGGRVADTTANCGGGTTVSCSGTSCTSTDKGPGQEGGCACSTGNTMDIKPCPDVA